MSAENPAKAPAAAASALPSPGEADYEAICAAVFATERGRWFLSEYARRNRQADTADLVAAIERIAARSGADATLPSGTPPCGNTDFERLRTELAETADAIARARTELASAIADPAAGDRTLQDAARPDGAAAEPLDILSAAEQIREVAWTMREQGFDSQFSDRLDRCAAAICLASSRQDRGMLRVRKIRHMMRHLQGRIDAIIAMLDAAVPAVPAGAQDVVALDETPSPDDSRLRQSTPLLLGTSGQATEPPEASLIPPCAAADGGERDLPQDDPKELGSILMQPSPEKEEMGESGDSAMSSTDIAKAAPADAPTARAERNGTALTIEGPKGSFSIMPAHAAEPPDLIPPPPPPQPPQPPQPPLEPDSTASDVRAFSLELAAEEETAGPLAAQSPIAVLPPATPSVVPEASGVAPAASAASDDDIFRQAEGDLPLAEAPRLGDPPQPPVPEPPAAARVSADIAEHVLADVMALGEEERLALFT